MRARSPKAPALLVVTAFVLAVLALGLTGCGVSGAPPFTGPFDAAVERGVIRGFEEIPLDSPPGGVVAGAGSVWTTDNGNYECGCGGLGSAGASGSPPGAGEEIRLVCSCAAPRYVFANQIDPGSGERAGRLRLDGSEVFGAYRVGGSRLMVAEGGVAALDRDGEVARRIQLEQGAGREYVSAVDRGGGNLWLADFGGTVYRLSPGDDTPSRVARLGAGVNDLAAGKSAVWVASGRGFEKGRKAVDGLTRLDPESGEVVSEVRVQARKPVSGAGDVAVDEDTGSVWAASNNGKLFQIDPGTNEVVNQTKLGGYVQVEEAREGDVWVNVLEPDGKLVRVDGETGEVVGSIRVSVSGVAASGDHLWVTRDGKLFKLTI